VRFILFHADPPPELKRRRANHTVLNIDLTRTSETRGLNQQTIEALRLVGRSAKADAGGFRSDRGKRKKRTVLENI